jgi:hypothetical protein
MDTNELTALCRNLGRALFEQHLTNWAEGKMPGEKTTYGFSPVANDEATKLIVDTLVGAGLTLDIQSQTAHAVERPGADFTLMVDGLSDPVAYLAATSPVGKGSQRYGTMFGLFKGDDPTFGDGVISCIVEYSTGRLLIANETGVTITFIDGSRGEPAVVSADKLGSSIVYCEDRHLTHGEVLKTLAADPLRLAGINTVSTESAARNILDVARGTAQGIVMFSGEGRAVAPIIGYHIITQAGGTVLQDGSSFPVGEKKYSAPALPEIFIFGNSANYARHLRTILAMARI